MYNKESTSYRTQKQLVKNFQTFCLHTKTILINSDYLTTNMSEQKCISRISNLALLLTRLVFCKVVIRRIFHDFIFVKFTRLILEVSTTRHEKFTITVS